MHTLFMLVLFKEHFMPASIQFLQERYQKMIDKQGGVDAVFKFILDYLHQLYLKNPIKIQTILESSGYDSAGSPRNHSRGCSPINLVIEDNGVYPFVAITDTTAPMLSREISPLTLATDNLVSAPSRAISPSVSFLNWSHKNDDEPILPIDWNEFMALRLPEGLFKRAMTAYHKNEVVTVIRYVEQFYRFVDDQGNSKVLDEAHKLRIVLFYLSVHDTDLSHDLWLETPTKHFLNTLLGLARQHNQIDGKDDLDCDQSNFDSMVFLDACFSDFDVPIEPAFQSPYSELNPEKSLVRESPVSQMIMSLLDNLRQAVRGVFQSMQSIEDESNVESYIEFEEEPELVDLRHVAKKVCANELDMNMHSYSSSNASSYQTDAPRPFVMKAERRKPNTATAFVPGVLGKFSIHSPRGRESAVVAPTDELKRFDIKS